MQKGPWKNFNQSNWVLDPREKKAGEGVRRILARGSPAARVEWPGKIRSSRRTWWRGRGGLGLAESDSSAASRVAARGDSSGSNWRGAVWWCGAGASLGWGGVVVRRRINGEQKLAGDDGEGAAV